MENTNNWVDWLCVQRKLIVGGVVYEFTKFETKILDLFFKSSKTHLHSLDLVKVVYPNASNLDEARKDITLHIHNINEKLASLGWRILYEGSKGRRLLGFNGQHKCRVGVISPNCFEPENAPNDRPFVGLLSNGVFSILSKPHPQSEYADFWECEDGYTVPINPTCRNYVDFIALVSWCEIPQEMHEASAQLSGKTLEYDGMKDTNFSNSATSGDM